MEVVHAAIKGALLRRAISFDAIRHLVLCRVGRRVNLITLGPSARVKPISRLGGVWRLAKRADSPFYHSLRIGA